MIYTPYFMTSTDNKVIKTSYPTQEIIKDTGGIQKVAIKYLTIPGKFSQVVVIVDINGDKVNI